MKRFRQILCIFLSILVLFFGVNNSYFSPHKIETVEAAEIVVGGGVVITASAIIQFLCAIVVAGLSIGLIIEWSDMDIEAIAQDLHDWCKENYDAIADYVAAVPGIQQWINTDEWVIVVDFAGGSSAPQPSPSPNNKEEVEIPPATDYGVENPPATDYGSAGLTSGEFLELLTNHHGFTNAFKAVAGAIGSGVTLASFLTPLAMINESGQYQDAEGNILDSNDPRIASVQLKEPYINIAATYIADKVASFGSVEEGSDPITDALKYRYSNQSSNDTIYYDGNYSVINGEYIYKIYSTASWTSDAGQVYDYIYYNKNGEAFTSKYQIAGYYEISDYWKGNTIKTYYNSNSEILEYNNNCVYDLWINGIQKKWGDYLVSGTSNYCNYFYTSGGYSVNFPVFSSYDEMAAFLRGEIDDSTCINISRPNNYIDSNDDYGWASTADISPSDLIAAYPGLASDMSGRNVSFPDLFAAINALKSQLEEQNPNVAPDADPLPYPDVPTYKKIVQQIITDPEIFPQTTTVPDVKPGTNTETNPDIEPDAGTDTSPNYSGFLQTIIDILQSILNLLKQFFAWFIIDFATIKAHLLSALTSIPAFEEFNPILDYIDYFRSSIGDSYEYPVISVNTPDILLPYYKDAVIILVDFKDYAKYFVWVRAFLSFSIYFGFGLWLINDIRKFFSGL